MDPSSVERALRKLLEAYSVPWPKIFVEALLEEDLQEVDEDILQVEKEAAEGKLDGEWPPKPIPKISKKKQKKQQQQQQERDSEQGQELVEKSNHVETTENISDDSSLVHNNPILPCENVNILPLSPSELLIDTGFNWRVDWTIGLPEYPLVRCLAKKICVWAHYLLYRYRKYCLESNQGTQSNTQTDLKHKKNVILIR
jgi:hypothetical protein